MKTAAEVRHRVCAHDLVFDFIPESYFEGLPMGNGELGAMLWFENDRLVLSLDHADIWEHRADQSLEEGMDYATALKQARDRSFDPTCRLFNPKRPQDQVWGNNLPVGRVEWKLPSKPLAFAATLCIYDATFTGKIELEDGELSLSGYLHAHENRVLLEIQVSGSLNLDPGQPRAQCFDASSRRVYDEAWNYPDPEYGGQSNDRFVTQVYNGDEKYAVASRHQADAHGRLCAEVTVVTGAANDDLHQKGTAELDRYTKCGEPTLTEEHLGWWKEFWSRSQLSLPDAALERLWYMEIYKLGCNAREDKHVISCMGIWNPDWRIPPCYGDLHHNLETEMNYWHIFGSNHIELAKPLYNLLVRELPRFENNCRTFFGWDGAYLPANMGSHGEGVGFMWFPWNLQVGVGAWLAQHFWWHYLYSGDEEFLRFQAWPYMEAVGRFWIQYLEEEEDGKLHVPWSYSPEYDDPVCKGKDSAFDLSLVRYLFDTIIDASSRLGLADSEVEPYRSALEKLAPLPVDETGIQVYAGKPLEKSHRHFSHLMAIHPLGFLNIEGSDEDRALIDTSLYHLRQIGMGNWSGWSWAWIALIAGRTGRANMAHTMLRFYTDHVMLHNTLQVSVDWKKTGIYTAEHGLINTLEAGTGAAAAVIEMLLQSWGEKIRVFPALPEDWRQSAFDTLRAEGAFLVSAEYADGVTQWVRIGSEAGNRCTIHNPWPDDVAVVRHLNSGIEKRMEGTDLIFNTEKGGSYELTPVTPVRRSMRSTTRGQGSFSSLPHWD